MGEDFHMSDVRFSVLAMIVVLISTPALAQNQPPQLTPEQKADTEALRTLVNAAPESTHGRTTATSTTPTMNDP
jgi:hypothetical protein